MHEQLNCHIHYILQYISSSHWNLWAYMQVWIIFEVHLSSIGVVDLERGGQRKRAPSAVGNKKIRAEQAEQSDVGKHFGTRKFTFLLSTRVIWKLPRTAAAAVVQRGRCKSSALTLGAADCNLGPVVTLKTTRSLLYHEKIVTLLRLCQLS